jgi:hypothetical protein
VWVELRRPSIQLGHALLQRSPAACRSARHGASVDLKFDGGGGIITTTTAITIGRTTGATTDYLTLLGVLTGGPDD